MSEDLSLRALLSASALAPVDAKILMAHVLEKHYQLTRSALLSRDDITLDLEALANWKELETNRLHQAYSFRAQKQNYSLKLVYVKSNTCMFQQEFWILAQALEQLPWRLLMKLLKP